MCDLLWAWDLTLPAACHCHSLHAEQKPGETSPGFRTKAPQEGEKPRGLHKTHSSHLTFKSAASGLASSLTLSPSHYPDLPGQLTLPPTHAAASQTRHDSPTSSAQHPHVLPGPLSPSHGLCRGWTAPAWFILWWALCVSLLYCGPLISVLGSVYLQAFFS